jgi:hypothetical protein
MNRKQYALLGSLLGLLAGLLVYWSRPAPLKSARVTVVTSGDPPTASVALRYGAGAVPARVIVDLASDTGGSGSATVDGKQMFLEVPLVDAPSDRYRITTTATYRVAGRLHIVVRDFPTTLDAQS